MADLFDNPLKTDGFSFIEYTGNDIPMLEKLFATFAFTPVARHRTRDVVLYRQGKINFLLNRDKGGQAQAFRTIHKEGANAMGFRVHDAEYAFHEAIKRGGTPAEHFEGSMDGALHAIEGIGGSVLYFVDDDSVFDKEFEFTAKDEEPQGAGLTYIDHVTHNVYRGNMVKWAEFYEKIFNFREIRYFDIEGKQTGLKSKAMTSPCGKIRIPLNESSDDKSQIHEFLERYNGEGIQHIALGTDDIYHTVEALKHKGVPFQTVPDTYYELLDSRVPDHGEDNRRLESLRILLDGAPTQGQGLLLQIFTQDAIGPEFFEIIQRKGNEGFGEGNFRALFECIELDQVRRGYLKEEKAAV